MKLCPNCNTQLGDDAKFCPGCGTTLGAVQANAINAAASYAEPIISDTSYAPQPQEQPLADTFAQPAADNTFAQPAAVTYTQPAADTYAQPVIDEVQPVIDPYSQPTMDSVQVPQGYDNTAYGYDQRVEVFGSLGMAADENDGDSTVKVSTAAGVVGDKPQFFFLERYMQSFGDEVREFIKAIQNGTDVPVGIQDGLAPIKIAQAANLSMKEHRPVKLSEIK